MTYIVSTDGTFESISGDLEPESPAYKGPSVRHALVLLPLSLGGCHECQDPQVKQGQVPRDPLRHLAPPCRPGIGL